MSYQHLAHAVMYANNHVRRKKNVSRPLGDICIENLVKALETMREFETVDFGVHCEHDILMICGLDIERLKENPKVLAKIKNLRAAAKPTDWASVLR